MPGRTVAPRGNTTEQVNYIRFGVAFSNTEAQQGLLIGCLPVGSFITDVAVDVNTPFNAGTNALTLGVTKTNANELLAAGDIAPGTANYQTNARGKGMQFTKVPTPLAGAGGDDPQGGVGIWAKLAFTGAAATAGLAVIVVSFIPPTTSV